MPNVPLPRRAALTAESVQTLADTDLLELVVTRVAGLVLGAAAVAGRSEFLPCQDYWTTRERLARLDDVVFTGQRLLQYLGAV